VIGYETDEDVHINTDRAFGTPKGVLVNAFPNLVVVHRRRRLLRQSDPGCRGLEL
jgi:hypothetical protein